MDRGLRYRTVTWRVGAGVSALLLLPLLLLPSGCHRGEHGATSPPPVREEVAGDNTAHAAAPEWLPPVVATEEAGEAEGISPSDNTAIGATATVGLPASPLPEAEAASDATAPRDDTAPSMSPPSGFTPADTPSHVDAQPSARKQKPAAPLHTVPAPPPKGTAGTPIPEWAKRPEELIYRVDFIGITMGYARFRYQGKVLLAGKPVYHLNVRAWTSGVLSFIYPINDTIDYYLDAETLAPLRQEFTKRAKGKDDVALYNQETGRITYRYRETGAIRKQVDTPPPVYDPVSVAYYFRWKDLGVENRPRNMYGGRKVYQISSRVLGYERIRTRQGEVDTIAVLPVIRRNGKPDNKGDLKIWFSNDERRVPVRLYAKFRKIKDWTLVGELMPPVARTGG